MTTEQITTRIVTHTPGGKLVTHGGAGTAYVSYGCRCEECTEANARRQKRLTAGRRERLDSGSFTHGVGGYSNWGCRCDVCSDAQRARLARDRADRIARAATDAPHGTQAAYGGWGCRCEDCKKAAALYTRAKYLRSKAKRGNR